MIRLIFASFILCVSLVAVEPDELPALGFAPPAKAAPVAAAAEAQTQREADLRTQALTEATKPVSETSKLPSEEKKVTPAVGESQDLSLRWTERDALPPRLAADLVTRSAPAIRPIAADYRLKAGDLVRVVAWGGQAVNERIPVAPNGDLAVPGFGLVPVAGATASEAQARVLELVRSHFKQGGAVVAVEQPAAQAVTVVGEVAKPGYLVLPPGGTVLEALAAAGGVLPRGSLRAIRIAAGGEPTSVDLYRVAVDGDAGVLAPLPAGALVFVPLAGPQVQVFGAVRRMSGIELKSGESLAEALRLAGGLSADADPAAIRLLREGAGGQELSQLASAALAGLPAADGDRLLVSLR
ncbi:MAG TPA: hypothetical protein DCS97_11935, partial [Planctomycetes bacterium]|nr:hypothetical protein [Planctomycetota bacterium]